MSLSCGLCGHLGAYACIVPAQSLLTPPGDALLALSGTLFLTLLSGLCLFAVSLSGPSSRVSSGSST